VGRPKANIDWGEVDRYLQAQCDGTAIASILGIHPDTLYRACDEKYKMTFTAYSAIKKAEGVELLKAKQFQTAMEGNVTMQVWLGKQYAGQRDKIDNEHQGAIQINVKYEERNNGNTPEATR
jgi:hypothetical protein